VFATASAIAALIASIFSWYMAANYSSHKATIFELLGAKVIGETEKSFF